MGSTLLRICRAAFGVGFIRDLRESRNGEKLWKNRELGGDIRIQPLRFSLLTCKRENTSELSPPTQLGPQRPPKPPSPSPGRDPLGALTWGPQPEPPCAPDEVGAQSVQQPVQHVGEQGQDPLVLLACLGLCRLGENQGVSSAPRGSSAPPRGPQPAQSGDIDI